MCWTAGPLAWLWGATSSGSHVIHQQINAFVITMSDTTPTAAEDEKSVSYTHLTLPTILLV